MNISYNTLRQPFGKLRVTNTPTMEEQFEPFFYNWSGCHPELAEGLTKGVVGNVHPFFKEHKEFYNRLPILNYIRSIDLPALPYLVLLTF